MLLVGLIAVGVPIIISIKHKREMKVESRGGYSPHCHQEDDVPVEPRPLSSLGIHASILGEIWSRSVQQQISTSSYLSSIFTGFLESYFIKLESILEYVADHVSESMLVSLVCLPIGFYYFGFALLSRVMPRVRGLIWKPGVVGMDLRKCGGGRNGSERVEVSKERM